MIVLPGALLAVDDPRTILRHGNEAERAVSGSGERIRNAVRARRYDASRRAAGGEGSHADRGEDACATGGVELFGGGVAVALMRQVGLRDSMWSEMGVETCSFSLD